MSLSKQNLGVMADHVRARLVKMLAVDHSDDLPFLQHLAIDLDGLRAAVEQRIQELGSHDPQDFG